MELAEIIQKRYSCRSYLQKPIGEEHLQKILEAARQAPSAKNFQDWRFVVATDAELRRRLAEAANNQMFIAEAGVVIAACSNSDYVMRCGQPIGPIDVAIALEHIALQAAELGLATCWIGSFDAGKVRAVLGIPAEITVVELMAVGYPADPAKPHSRVEMEKIVSFEKWDF